MDHALSQSRQRAVLSLAKEQAQVREAAQKQLMELEGALKELLALYVGAAHLEGEWQFTQNAAGEIILRPVEKPPAEAQAGEDLQVAKEI